MLRVGVLALQGDFSKHVEMLKTLNVIPVEVRTTQDLQQCEGLIIPGGESTVISRQLDFVNLRDPLLTFARQKPLFGTCAGLILMSKKVIGQPFKSLELLDITVERNAFGRQIESFQTTLALNLEEDKTENTAFFIRAPRIKEWGKEVRVLGEWQEEPVLVQQGYHLGATFHPELTHDAHVHRYFIRILEQRAKALNGN